VGAKSGESSNSRLRGSRAPAGDMIGGGRLQVVGVDGYRKGWVAVILLDGVFLSAAVHQGFREVLDSHRDAEVIAVDIPIGLPVGEVRQADIAARQFLESRWRSVFLCPPRAVLECSTHVEASQLNQELTGFGVSLQSFGLRHMILEVDALVGPNDGVIEVHPEASFLAMNQTPLQYSKKSWGGLVERAGLLADHGIQIPAEHGAAVAPADDVLDAAAAAWSARRFARGKAESLPVDPPVDERGRPVAIWC
jgi:predicted RNase H-like nuclease